MRVFLEDVPDRYAFFLKDGKRLVNVQELAKALQKMELDVFSHHVNDSRHDFHNWVRDIVLDLELAEELLNAKTPEEASKIIDKRIKFIKSQIKPAKKTVAKKPTVKKTVKKAAKKTVKKKATKSKK